MPTQVTPVVRPAPATQITPPDEVPSTQLWPSESGATQQQNTPSTSPQSAPPPHFGNAASPPGYQQQPWQSPQPPAPNYQQQTGGGLQQNLAGLLCYITFIPAIIFLVLEPYNRNRFIRFHAFQCLFLTAASFIINVAISIIVNILPGILAVVVGLLSLVVSLGFIAIWVFMLIKAYNNEMYKLPVIGDLAEQQAGR
jgi:uncharacterized membrane protein